MNPRGEAPAIWALALGQTLTYAGVYYAFPALLPDLLALTGWSGVALAAGPTIAFLLTAVLTPFTGRLVDRGLGGEMLVCLPVVAALCVALLGFSPNHAVWIALWAVIGVTQAGMYYETCFAFLTRRLGDRARPAITRVTLIAGFAGTLAFPLAHWLSGLIGPAQTLVVFAGLILFGAVPLNLFAVRQLRRNLRSGAPVAAPHDPADLSRALRKPPFWIIAVMSGVLGLNHTVLLTFVLVLFVDRGASAGMATLAAACIGPAQVLGRLFLMLMESRVNNARATMICIAGVTLANVALLLAGVAPVLIFLFAALQGAGMGTLSILRPVLVAQTLGRAGFGAISGAIAVFPTLAAAFGPTIGAAVLQIGGAGVVLGLTLALSILGLGLGMLLIGGMRKSD